MEFIAARRTPKWKLIRDYLNPTRDELFDLTNDPDETKNVIKDPANHKLLVDLDDKLIKQMQKISDPVIPVY